MAEKIAGRAKKKKDLFCSEFSMIAQNVIFLQWCFCSWGLRLVFEYESLCGQTLRDGKLASPQLKHRQSAGCKRLITTGDESEETFGVICHVCLIMNHRWRLQAALLLAVFTNASVLKWNKQKVSVLFLCLCCRFLVKIQSVETDVVRNMVIIVI